MNDKEMLEKLFEFEAYASARFDSKARVAFAVYDYVKRMKRYARLEMISFDDKTYPDALKTYYRANPDKDEEDE